MTDINCTNINLKKGSKDETTIKTIQTTLKKGGYYSGSIDGIFGELTEKAVKQFQKEKRLKVDGIFGPVTCKALNTNSSGGIYTSVGHYSTNGCNKKGQCTSYFCAPHSIRQIIAKCDIDYTEQTIAGWAGTTSAGTSHEGINTALRMIQIKSGKTIKAEWKNFSELGTSLKERFKAIGEIIQQKDKQVIVHSKYKGKWGHYEFIKEININNQTCTIYNSLGSKCGNTAYCGFTETRTFNTFSNWINLISQKSICIITIGN